MKDESRMGPLREQVCNAQRITVQIREIWESIGRAQSGLSGSRPAAVSEARLREYSDIADDMRKILEGLEASLAGLAGLTGTGDGDLSRPDGDDFELLV